MSSCPTTPQFLDPPQASTHIQKYHQPYLNETLLCATNAALRTYSSEQTFCDHLVPWTLHQRERVSTVIRELQARCWSWRRLLCGVPWLLMQVRDTLEDGMPHTIHSAIVLPVWLVSALCDTASGDRRRRAVETLVHERVHVMQKVRRASFDDLYHHWGFQRADSTRGACQEAIRVVHEAMSTRTNPDTPNRWVLHERWYLFVHLPNDAPTMRDVHYYVVDLEGVARGQPVHRCVQHIAANEWYNAYYGRLGHCYHPDESAAVLLASLVVHDHDPQTYAISGDVWRCPAYGVMVQWMNA